MKERFYHARRIGETGFTTFISEDGESFYSHESLHTTKPNYAKEELEILKEITFTWQDLKHFCNRLPESEMNTPVRFVGEGINRPITTAQVYDEDQVCPDDYIEPLSAYKDEPDAEEYDLTVVYPKGFPMLYTD